MTSEQKSNRELHKFVIVGGGAGGLIWPRPWPQAGKRRQALITLVTARARTSGSHPASGRCWQQGHDDHELDYLYQRAGTISISGSDAWTADPGEKESTWRRPWTRTDGNHFSPRHWLRHAGDGVAARPTISEPRVPGTRDLPGQPAAGRAFPLASAQRLLARKCADGTLQPGNCTSPSSAGATGVELAANCTIPPRIRSFGSIASILNATSGSPSSKLLRDPARAPQRLSIACSAA